MASISIPKTDKASRIALQKLSNRLKYDSSPTFTGLTLTGLTASRLIQTNASKGLSSVTNFTNWVAGTTNRITVADDGDGTITLSTPQDIHTGASPTFAGLALGVGSITMTGSIGTTGARVTKGWFTDLECTNAIVGGLIALSSSSGVLIKNFNGVTVASFGLGGASSLNVGLLGNTVNTGQFTAANVVINGTVDTGLDMSGGTFATNAINTGTAPINFVKVVRLHDVRCVGDSLTADGTYVTQLASLLGTLSVVINKGVNGDDTTEMDTRFTADILSDNCDYVVIWGGINDIVNDFAAATTEANLQSMYTAAHNAGLKVVSVNISPFKGNVLWSAARQAVLDEVNTWIANTATNIDYKINAYSILEDPGVADTLLAAYDSGDSLHLSAAGYNLVGTSVYNGVTWTSSLPITIKSTQDVALYPIATLDGLVLEGTTPTGLDMSTGTFATGTQNWPDQFVINSNGTRVFHNFQHLTGGGAVPEGLNTFIGVSAGNLTMGSTATETYHASRNTGVGYKTLFSNTTGYYNFAMGTYSLYTNDTGFQNTGIGVETLYSNSSGDSNTAIGLRACWSNTTGDGNIGIGAYTLRFNQTGHNNVGIGTSAGEGVSGSSFSSNVLIGIESGISLSTGSANVFLGYRSGYNQTTNGNLLIIDNQNRTSTALELTNSLIYGVFNAAVASQSLRINAGTLTFNGGVDTDITMNFIGTTTSGLLNWMEDEDYFKFSDDILMNTTEKIHFLDTAIGIYSQADTFLDIFADGGVRIGNSSAGAPTNYSKFESDGTLQFNGTATVFNDANVGAMALTLPVATQPDEVNFVDELGADTGITTWGFAIGEKVSGAIEIPHDYKEGTDLTFHVHWQGIAAPAGGTDNVKWQLEYTVERVDTTLDAKTTITVETAITTRYHFKRSDFAAITGTNFKIGDQFLFTLSRIAASADEYAGDALIATVGFHYECDTCGSRAIITK